MASLESMSLHRTALERRSEKSQCCDARTFLCAVLGACCYIAAQNEARARKEAAFREEREAQVRWPPVPPVPLDKMLDETAVTRHKLRAALICNLQTVVFRSGPLRYGERITLARKVGQLR